MYSNILLPDEMLFLLSKGGREEEAGGTSNGLCDIGSASHGSFSVCPVRASSLPTCRLDAVGLCGAIQNVASMSC